VVTVDRLLEAGHRGEVLRFALLSGHYRSPLPWTESLVAQSKATLDGLYRKAGDAVGGGIDAGVIEALSDDLNTPLAIARLGQIEDGATLRASCGLLGLLTVSEAQWFRGEGDSSGIEKRIEARTKAKQNRDFAESDRIRDELKAEGILLEDGPDGTTWRRA
jgi:cysteinyl-tRNA synthetase